MHVNTLSFKFKFKFKFSAPGGSIVPQCRLVGDSTIFYFVDVPGSGEPIVHVDDIDEDRHSYDF